MPQIKNLVIKGWGSFVRLSVCLAVWLFGEMDFLDKDPNYVTEINLNDTLE